MDILTQRISELGHRLLKELRQIGTGLTQIQNQIKTVSEQNKPEKKEDGPPQEVIARLAFPAGIDTEKNASEKRKQRRDRWRLFVEVLTLLSVFGYGLVAYHQWKEMIIATGAAQQAVTEARLNRGQAEKSLDATIDQFHLDQRAWIGIESVAGELKLGENFDATVSVKNTGKTPAKNFSFLTTYHPVQRGDKLTYTYIPVTTEPSRELMSPNAVHGMSAHPVPEQKASQVDIDRIVGGETTIYVYGKGTYDDVFSCKHWLTFCYHLLPDKKSWAACKDYNDTGDDKCEPKPPKPTR